MLIFRDMALARVCGSGSLGPRGAGVIYFFVVGGFLSVLSWVEGEGVLVFLTDPRQARGRAQGAAS
jgi:hypothetical protein